MVELRTWLAARPGRARPGDPAPERGRDPRRAADLELGDDEFARLSAEAAAFAERVRG